MSWSCKKGVASKLNRDFAGISPLPSRPGVSSDRVSVWTRWNISGNVLELHWAQHKLHKTAYEQGTSKFHCKGTISGLSSAPDKQTNGYIQRVGQTSDTLHAYTHWRHPGYWRTCKQVQGYKMQSAFIVTGKNWKVGSGLCYHGKAEWNNTFFCLSSERTSYHGNPSNSCRNIWGSSSGSTNIWFCEWRTCFQSISDTVDVPVK